LRLTVATGDFKRREAAEMLPVSVTATITDIASKRSIRVPAFPYFGKFPTDYAGCPGVLQRGTQVSVGGSA
jgi:hypothetical protein